MTYVPYVHKEYIDLWVAAIRQTTGEYTKEPILFTRTHTGIKHLTTENPEWSDILVRHPGYEHCTNEFPMLIVLATPVFEEAKFFIKGMEAAMISMCRSVMRFAHGNTGVYSGNSGTGYEMFSHDQYLKQKAREAKEEAEKYDADL